MMQPKTVGDLISQLQTMVKLGHVKLETPLICASDDEGNSYDYVYNFAEPMLFNLDDRLAYGFEDYIDMNYKDLHDNYKERLRDTGRYEGHPDLDEVSDGRKEFVYEAMREDFNNRFTLCIN